jgi:hypothetical protein
MDDWTKDLSPDEAQAALEALNANKAPITAMEAAELLMLNAGGQRRKTVRLGACSCQLCFFQP